MQSSINKIKWHQIALFGYLIFSIAFGILWSKDYGHFTTMKGDEYIYFIGYDILLAVVFFIILSAIQIKVRRLVLLAIIPVLTVIPSVVLTFIIEILGNKNSTTDTDLLVYGIVYPSLNVLVYLFFKAKFFKAT